MRAAGPNVVKVKMWSLVSALVVRYQASSSVLPRCAALRSCRVFGRVSSAAERVTSRSKEGGLGSHIEGEVEVRWNMDKLSG